MAKRRVLVTGGTGFIGRHLIRRLAQVADLEVLTMSRHPLGVDLQPAERVDLGDLKQVRAWAARRIDEQGLQGVFHLAADVPSRFDSKEAGASFKANIGMTQSVLSVAEEYGCPVIYASSASVYGPSLESPVNEDAPATPDNKYSEGKLFGETLMASTHQRCGMPTVSLRIAAPYGPDQRLRNVIHIFLDAAISGQKLTVQGSGQRTQDFTFVTDVADAFWLAFAHRAVGVFNVSGGRPVTMRRLAELAVAAAGSSSRIEVGSVADPQDGYRGSFLIDKARRAFGFEPQVSLEEGLARCLAARAASDPA